jgi:hypothetical protein
MSWVSKFGFFKQIIFINNIFSIDWFKFYRQKWVIASLNKCMSKIDNATWLTSPNNTNVAEAAHALSNRCGKNLKLVTAILQYDIYNLFTCILLY